MLQTVHLLIKQAMTTVNHSPNGYSAGAQFTKKNLRTNLW